jgi:hypothetical protein
MRKAYALVEVLIIVVTLPFVLVVLDAVFRDIVRDIPRASRVVQENKTLVSMLNQLRSDIDQAVELPESFAERTSDGESLLIKLEDNIVCYQMGENEVIRYTFTNDKDIDSANMRVWSLPTAEISWRLWRENGNGYAVEVKSYIKLKLREKYQKKMANSHVFFLGVL